MRHPVISRQPPLAAPFLPPLAVLAALLAHAGHQVDPQAAAETAYLGLLAGGLLLAVAALEAAPGEPRAAGRGGVVATASVLVVLAAWSLPAGPLRGAVVVAVGVAGLALAAGRRLVTGRSPAAPAAQTAGGSSIGGQLALLLPLAVAIQLLVRSDRLLAPEPGWRLVAGLLGLPLVAAAATALLLVRCGRAPATTAAATAALLGPGFNLLSTGALVVLAAAVAAASRPGAEGAAARRARRMAAAGAVVAAALLAVAEPAVGVVAALGVLLLTGRWMVSAAVAAGALATLVVLPASVGGNGELALAVTAVAPLAPIVVLAVASPAGRRWAGAAIAAALLAAVAARSGLGPPGLVVPLAALPLLAGRSLAGSAPARRHALFAPQIVWSAALLAAALLAAGYPWLRERPLATVLAVLGAAPGWSAVALVAAVAAGVVGLEAAGRRLQRSISGRGVLPADRRAAGERTEAPAERVAVAAAEASLGAAGLSPWVAAPPAGGVSVGTGSSAAAGFAGGTPGGASPRRVAGLAAVAVLLAAFAALPPPRRATLLPAPVTLTADRPRLELELPPPEGAAAGEGRVEGGVVLAETSLSHAVAVGAGAPVATFRVVPGAGPAGGGASGGSPAAPTPHAGSREVRTLRAGRDTAEWAIRRPDVAAAAAHPAPAPWLARVTAEGFFGLTFRSRLPLPAAGGGARLVVERHPTLPPGAAVHLHRLEVRR